MLPRTLEPELMDTPDEARDYDSMDHSTVNESFSKEFLEAFAPELRPATGGVGVRQIENPKSKIQNPPPSEIRNPKSEMPSVLDVGTGTARIPIAICRLTDRLRITAVDLAGHMLELARRNVAEAGFTELIRIEQIDAKALPYPDDAFDAVISNSIVHHIPQPIRVLREMLRVLRPGGLLFVRDLFRPPDAETIARLLAQYAGGTNDHQRQLFEQSFHAALTLEEVRALLLQLGLDPSSVHASSDRHWTITARKASGTAAPHPEG